MLEISEHLCSTQENNAPCAKGEEKMFYTMEELVEKAKKNRAEAHKKVPMTEKEKLQAKVARLQAQIAKMESEEA